jgi:hypothetical protein
MDLHDATNITPMCDLPTGEDKILMLAGMDSFGAIITVPVSTVHFLFLRKI